MFYHQVWIFPNFKPFGQIEISYNVHCPVLGSMRWTRLLTLLTVAILPMPQRDSANSAGCTHVHIHCLALRPCPQFYINSTYTYSFKAEKYTQITYKSLNYWGLFRRVKSPQWPPTLERWPPFPWQFLPFSWRLQPRIFPRRPLWSCIWLQDI